MELYEILSIEQMLKYQFPCITLLIWDIPLRYCNWKRDLYNILYANHLYSESAVALGW